MDIDRQLTQEVRVHCLGGFVVALFSPVRSTRDLDYIETIPHDLVLSKLTRNHTVDQADVEFLAKHIPLDPETLRDRYEREFRSLAIGDSDWNRQTLDLWIEDYFKRG